MLKKLFVILLMLFSFSSIACWKVTGQMAVDGQSWKINHKIDHNKEYIFPMGSFIFKMTIKENKDKTHLVLYVIQEKKGTSLTLVSQGEEIVKANESHDIYAKGEIDQPHSIITVKITHI